VRIVVTGASGFVGGTVATALADDGHEVVGTGTRTDGWSHPVGRYVRWELPGAPPRVLQTGSVDAVVHAAAIADDWADAERIRAVNVEGTRSVIDAFRTARIVHVSSSSVSGSGPCVDLPESAVPPVRYPAAYGATKAAAERVVLSARPDAVVLRPHAVYGPGDTTLMPRILDAARGGRLVLPNGGRSLHSFTHVRTVVDAVRLALDPAVPGGPVAIGDAEPMLLSDAVTAMLRARGAAVRIVAVPEWVALLAATLAERRARRTGTRPRITRYAVMQLAREHTYRLDRARDVLGLRPPRIDLSDAADW
jgi:2-alkyl-3-oxoalkanoate reductase